MRCITGFVVLEKKLGKNFDKTNLVVSQAIVLFILVLFSRLTVNHVAFRKNAFKISPNAILGNVTVKAVRLHLIIFYFSLNTLQIK